MTQKELFKTKTTDLGTMNGWKDDPQEYKDHIANCSGLLIRERLGNCYNQYTCADCGISYKVDSSGQG